jgi:CheY-like chemotaxis protein
LTTSARKKILLVEDEAIVAMAESDVVEEIGYHVVTALSAEKALGIIKADSSIDLVLMDIDLGKSIDGTEAARQILALRNLPIVFLTEHSERDMVEKVRGITRYGYVIKNSGDVVLQSSIEMAFELFNANRASHQSEERLRLIDDSSADFIYSNDRASRFTSANRSLCEAMGLLAGEIVGKTHTELGFPEEQCDEWDELHRRVYETPLSRESLPRPCTDRQIAFLR